MSDNLTLTQLIESQAHKEVTINDQAAELDAALTEVLTFAVDDTKAYVLTADDLQRRLFVVVSEGSPAPTAAVAVQAPAIRRACPSC